jgi:CheY-like chemotaxis protein
MEDCQTFSYKLEQTLVLVVDESTSCRQTAARLINESGRECIAVGDNLEALGILVESCPATIFIDRDSRPLDNWQFCELVRSHPTFRNVRIVVMNHRDTVVEQARVRAAGADAILLKPFASADLVSVLDVVQAAA